MNSELISIIVPIYNISDFIGKCIDSLLYQTYSNIEIILVDDGSTDNSLLICNDYRNNDKRISVYTKKNGGLSDARNFGLTKANGKYVVFIDGDDWIKDDYIETLYNAVSYTKSDMVISGLIPTKKYLLDKKNNKNDYKIISNSKALEICLYGKDGIDVSPCGKMYSKRLFDHIKYPLNMLYEDFLIIENLINNCKKIVVTKYKGYYYLYRPGSIMNSVYKKERNVLIEKSKDLIKNTSGELKDAAIYRYVVNNFLLLKLAIASNNIKVAKQFRNNILIYKKNVLRNKNTSLKFKIAIIILQLNINLYIYFRKNINKR